MAISTRMSRNPVTPSAQSPSIGARPSSSRPSSVKNSIAPSMSSTTMPTLSIRLTVIEAPYADVPNKLPARLPLRVSRLLAAPRLFDHFGENEQLRGNCDSERLGGLRVDHQVELGRLQDWQIGWLGALEDPAT